MVRFLTVLLLLIHGVSSSLGATVTRHCVLEAAVLASAPALADDNCCEGCSVEMTSSETSEVPNCCWQSTALADAQQAGGAPKVPPVFAEDLPFFLLTSLRLCDLAAQVDLAGVVWGAPDPPVPLAPSLRRAVTGVWTI